MVWRVQEAAVCRQKISTLFLHILYIIVSYYYTIVSIPASSTNALLQNILKLVTIKKEHRWQDWQNKT